jgi:predicted nucleotide-binding protein (sugar kinase/HSP70/actin superfamily)
MKMNYFKPARLTAKGIIDSNGDLVPFDDPRVVYVWPIDTNQYVVSLLKKKFKKHGLTFRSCGATNREVLQYAKNITSGKECLPFNSIAGSIYKDLQLRDKDEISLYYSASSLGPCQNSAWPLVFDTFLEKNKIRNALFNIILDKSTNYFGKGIALMKDFASVAYLSDLIGEAKSSLKYVAKDKMEALKVFNDTTNGILEAAAGNIPLKTAIKAWGNTLSKIPRKRLIEDAPKILVFGGLNLLFTNHPIIRYFEDNDIVVKCVDILEGVFYAYSCDIVKYSIESGTFASGKSYDPISGLVYYLNYFIKRYLKGIKKIKRTDKNRLKAANAILTIAYLEFMTKKYRKKMSVSGLLYDHYIPYEKLATEGDKYISNRALTESSIIVGRYLNTLNVNVFDGLINVGTFNCQPAMNSIAVLRSLSNEHNIPFISMDCDGGELSSNQIRLLETLSGQAKKYHLSKNVS